jgi:hypothetical protein
MTTTRTLRKLKKNSASPNQRTPNRFMTFALVLAISQNRVCGGKLGEKGFFAYRLS